MTHPRVQHPREFLRVAARERHWLIGANDAVLDWLTTHVLASILMFDVALILPLLVIPAPDSLKITLGVVSGSWIQWWALPALQRSSVKADQLRAAKAEADHQALTHVALTADHADRMVTAMAVRLGLDPVTGEDQLPRPRT